MKYPIAIMDQREATAFFAAFYRGESHIVNPVKPYGLGWRTVHHIGVDGLSTFDYDMLTRLVLLAHDRCVRVSLYPRDRQNVYIVIVGKVRGSGTLVTDHPTIEEAVAKFRTEDDAPWYEVLGRRKL